MNPFRSARMLVCALAALFGVAAAPAVHAQSLFLLDTVQLPDSQGQVGFVNGSAFAESVAMSGKYAVVGEPGFRINGLGAAGRVHVFVRDLQGQWSKIATFDGTQVDGQLGQSVAIDTSIPNEISVIAGSPGANSARAWLYMFDIQTWAYADLYAPAPVGTPGHSGDYGFSVAASGNWLFVGQPHYADGFVHVYRRYPGQQFVNYWTSATEVSAQGFDSEFGYSIAASGDAYVVGAPSYVAIDGPLPSAFVFRRSGTSWPRESQITRTFAAGVYSLGFGKSVAIDGDRCVVGAPDTTVAGVVNAGRATSFTRSGVNWPQERVYQDQFPQAGTRVGTRVAVDGRNVVLAQSAASIGTGYVKVYDSETGGQGFSNGTETPGVPSRFGAGIALDAGFLLVGDPATNAQRGSLYEYRLGFIDCDGDFFDDLLDIAAGVLADFDLDGIPDVCESPTCLLEELNASNGAANDQLGWSIATDGERVISGAITKVNASGIDAGAAFVYRRDGTHLVQEALLGGTNVHTVDSFGACVAIEGDLAFAGAPGDDTASSNAGALYVFRRNPSTGAWALETKLLAPDAASGANFGRSVAYAPSLSGALFVGATGANTPAGTGRGKVYVFERNGAAWIHRNTLFDLSGGAGDAFGYSVSITNNVLAIGAPYADPSGVSDAGVVHVGSVSAVLATPVTLVKLAQTVPQAGSNLGHCVAVGPNGRVAAGAPRDPTRGYIAGSVQLYYGLTSSPVLFPFYLSGGNDWDLFGTSVAWTDNRLLVGMPFIDTAQAPGAGQVCICRLDGSGWPIESARIGAPDGQQNQAFGAAIAWRNGLLVCGAYGDDVPNGTDSGSAYVFGLGGLDCLGDFVCDLCQIRAGTAIDANQNGVADSCDVMPFCYGDGSGAPCPCGNESAARSGGCKNSFGTGALLTATGHAATASDDLVLTATNMPATTTALFFQGTAKDGGGSGVTFGDGVRCVSGAIVRLRTRVASAGTASYPIAGDPSIHFRGNVNPGETRYYQVHYRNSSSTYCTSSTSNYTNGIAATWVPF